MYIHTTSRYVSTCQFEDSERVLASFNILFTYYACFSPCAEWSRFWGGSETSIKATRS